MYTVAFVSNVTYEPMIRQAIQKGECFQHDIQIEFLLPENIQCSHSILKKSDMVVIAINFDNWLPDAENQIISEDKNVVAIKNEVVMRSFLLYENIKKVTYAKVLWLGFEDYYTNLNNVCGSTYLLGSVVDDINLLLIKNISKTDSYICLKSLIAKTGVDSSFSIVDKYRWNMPSCYRL